MDIAGVDRIRKLMTHEQFLTKFFTRAEGAYIGRDPERAAGHFAAKEAFAKAFGTGFGSELGFLDLCILHDASGRPTVQVAPQLASRLAARGIETIHLSISHEREYAAAVVILE